MKLLKWIVAIVLLLILVIAGAIILVLNSAGIQKSLVMGQLEDKFQHVQLDYIKAGTSSFVIKGLELDQDGTFIELESAEVNYALWSALFSKKVVISKLAVAGLDVTLPAARETLPMGPGPVVLPGEKITYEEPTASKKSEPAPSTPDGPPPPFEGLFQKTSIPVELYIDGISVAATVKMTPEQSLVANISGGGIAPGKKGTIQLDASMKNASADAPAAQTDVSSTLTISQTNGQQLNAILLETVADAKGGQLQAPLKVTATVDLSIDEAGLEHYKVDVANSEQTLNITSVTEFNPEAKTLNGNGTLALVDRSIRHFVPSQPLPVFKVDGTFGYELSSEDYTGKSHFETKGSVRELKQVDSGLAQVPDLTFNAQYAGSQTLDSVTMNTLTAALKSAGGPTLFSMALQQPITLGEGSNLESLKGQVADLSLNGIKLAWLAPMIDDTDLQGGALSGQLQLVASGQKLQLKTTQPLKIDTLSVVQAGRPVLKGVSLSSQIDGTLTPDKLSLRLTKTRLFDAAGENMLTLKLDSETALKNGKPASVDFQLNNVVFFQPIVAQPAINQPMTIPVRLESKLSGGWMQSGTASLSTLESTLVGGKATSYLAVKLLKELKIDLNAGQIDPSTLIQGDTLQIDFLKMPRALMNAMVKDMVFPSGDLTGQLIISGKGQTISVKSPSPLQLSDLSVTQNGKPLIRNISGTLSPVIAYTSDSIQADLNDLRISDKDAVLISGQLSTTVAPQSENPLQKAVFDLQGSLAFLLRQPVAHPYNNLLAGRFLAKGHIDFANGGTYQATVEASNLKVRSPRADFEVVSFKPTGTSKLPQSISIKAPLRVKGPSGTTALDIDGTVAMKPKVKQFDIKATGQTIYLDDIQLLSAAFKNPDVAPAEPATTTAARQAATPAPSRPASKKATPTTVVAPWAGYEGVAALTIERIRSANYDITDLVAKATVTEPTVVLKPARAKIIGAPLEAEAVVSCRPDTRPTEPFGIVASLSLSQFDVGKFLTLSKPGQATPLTGKFDITGKVNGFAPTMEALAQTAPGEFALKGGPGKMRALASVGGGAEAAVGGLNSALGIAGSLLGKNSAGNIITVLRETINLMQNIDYNILEVQAKRAVNLNIILNPIRMQGPQLSLAGNGVVKNVADKPMPERPLDMSITLSAKDNAANLLNQLRLTSGKKDKQGYIQGPSFQVGGTPSSPDFSELQSIIVNAATKMVTQGGLGGNVQDGDSGDSNVDKATNLIKGLMGN